MKNKIIVTKAHDTLSFYLICEKGSAFLFSQCYSASVYNFFRCGRYEHELRRKYRWGRNPRLDHTVTKILNSSYRRYALAELSA